MKKGDCALLPPCSKTVQKKLQRAHYISILWGNGDSPHPGNNLDPLNYGWKKENGEYTPDWYTGPVMPDDLFHEVEGEEGDVNENEEDTHELNEEEEEDSDVENSWNVDSESEEEM